MAVHRYSQSKSSAPRTVSPSQAAERLIQTFAASIRGAREGEIKAVHDVRVCSRRLQEWVRIVGHGVGRSFADRLAGRLQRIRKAFQEVRDLDVLMASLSDFTGKADATDPLRELLKSVRAMRKSALQKARKRLAEVEHQDLVKKLRSTLSLPGRQGRDFTARFDRLARTWARSRLEAMTAFTDQDKWTGDLHQLRIHAKRFRYAREWMGWNQPKGSDPLLNILADLQQLLGAWNDHLVAARLVARLATRRKALAARPEAAASWLSYAALRADNAAVLGRQIVRDWPPARALIDSLHAKAAGL